MLSLFWVIAIEMLLIFLGINLKNLSIAYWIINLYIYPLIWTAFYGLDAYMLFMMATNFLSVRRYYIWHKGINIVDYSYLIFRRFIRIAPVYYLVFFSFWALLPFLSESPMWFIVTDDLETCKNTWGWSMLFLGNMIPFY